MIKKNFSQCLRQMNFYKLQNKRSHVGRLLFMTFFDKWTIKEVENTKFNPLEPNKSLILKQQRLKELENPEIRKSVDKIKEILQEEFDQVKDLSFIKIGKDGKNFIL